MRSIRILAAVLPILAAIGVQSQVLAQERYSDDHLGERFNLRIGGFLVTDFDTTLRLDSRQVPLGTSINLEDSLNVDKEVRVGRIDGFYRFNKKHRIDWSWYSFKREGETNVTEEIRIGDPDQPDGEIVIPVGARTETRFKFDIIKLGYAWSFLNHPRYELYLGGGLNTNSMSLDLSYQAGSGSAVESDSFDESAALPLPTMTFGGRWNFTPKLQINWRYEIFALRIGDEFQGRLQESYFLVEHNTFKNVGFGGGINAYNMDIELENDDWKGEIESSYLGLLAYVKVYF